MQNKDLKMQTVCVYCASSTQIKDSFFQAAEELAKTLMEANFALVYGAGATGLMGRLADTMLQYGGTVTGVIPRFMHQQAWHHSRLSSLIITETMHERKEIMAKMADAVVALPGGCGTMEELLEIITWKQLGIFTNPVVIVNTDNYFDPLIKMLQNAISEKFMGEIHANIWTVVSSPNEVPLAIQNSINWDESAISFAAL